MSYTGRLWLKTFLFFLFLSLLVLLLNFTEHKIWANGWDTDEVGIKHSIVIKVTDAWAYLLQFNGIPIGQTIFSFFYSLYRSFSLLNLAIFLLKYMTTVFYSCKMVKNFYVTSRERIMKTQMELEDIQLQIKIVNTKLSVCDAEFTERTELLKREAERLRTLRARVRDLIATDETLRRTLDRASSCGDDPVLGNTASDEEREYTIELLKELKKDQVPVSDGQSMKMDCGEQLPPLEVPTEEDSIYSSLSDEMKPECTVKIVRVTNVYRVAYLTHYMKQKRLRKATRHALLKKKIEAIKTLLEDWQKSLNRVLNTKLPISQTMNLDAVSEEATGDHSKPNLRELSDSETLLMTNGTNAYFDELNYNWTHNAYRPYQYEVNIYHNFFKGLYQSVLKLSDLLTENMYMDNFGNEATTINTNFNTVIVFQDLQEISVKEIYEPNYNENNKYGPPHTPHLCGCKTSLFMLPEETSSQVAIEEIMSEHDYDLETETRDDVAL